MNKQKLYKSRFFEPYTGDKSNLKFAKDKSGVYIIKRNGVISYIGYSATNLEKTCLRHFQSWEDTKQVRVTYKYRANCTVRLIICTPARAAKLERALIVRHEPKDNPDKLKHYKTTTAEKNIMAEYDQQEATKWAELDAMGYEGF